MATITVASAFTSSPETRRELLAHALVIAYDAMMRAFEEGRDTRGKRRLFDAINEAFSYLE